MLNGWSSAVDHPSSHPREQIIQDLGYDIYSINETFLRGNQQLSVCGYSWFGSNRHDIDPRAVRGSGGTGFLVKNSLFNQYHVQVLGSPWCICRGLHM